MLLTTYNDYMQHIAILGRQPALGMAELETVYSAKAICVLSKQAVRIESNHLDVQQFGGIPKAGKIIIDLPTSDWHQISQRLVQHYVNAWSSFDCKITLGISAYGFKIDAREVQKTGIILKQKLKKSGISLRLIPNPEPALSTAISHHNKLGLSPNKIEILIVRADNGKVTIAESTGSQNITAYAKRDQLRPKRDAFIGMLPPKLAQIMINLAVSDNQKIGTVIPISSERLRAGSDKGPDALSNSGCRCSEETGITMPNAQSSNSSVNKTPKNNPIYVNRTRVIDATAINGTLEPGFNKAPGPLVDPERSSAVNCSASINEQKQIRILDPFCGTGVILQEAALMGYSVYGTDLSEKMIRYSRDNLNWLADSHHIQFDWYLHEGDAMNTKWQQPIDAVVSEAYLGQPFSAPPSPAKLDEVKQNCNHIITEFLKNLSNQIAPNTSICIAVPAWQNNNGQFTHLPLISTIGRLGYKRHEFINVSQNDLLYYRKDQIVARELLILKKVK